MLKDNARINITLPTEMRIKPTIDISYINASDVTVHNIFRGVGNFTSVATSVVNNISKRQLSIDISIDTDHTFVIDSQVSVAGLEIILSAEL